MGNIQKISKPWKQANSNTFVVLLTNSPDRLTLLQKICRFVKIFPAVLLSDCICKSGRKPLVAQQHFLWKDPHLSSKLQLWEPKEKLKMDQRLPNFSHCILFQAFLHQNARCFRARESSQTPGGESASLAFLPPRCKTPDMVRSEVPCQTHGFIVHK